MPEFATPANPMPLQAGRASSGVEAGELADALRRKYGKRITGELLMPAREGRYEDIPPELDPAVADAWRCRSAGRWTGSHSSRPARRARRVTE